MSTIKKTTRPYLLAIIVSVYCYYPTTINAAKNNYAAEASGTVLSDKVFYQIGGGSAVMTPPSRKRLHEIGIGLGWNANLMCGNFDIKTTVKNQLNGVTEGFKDLMGNIIQSATGAVASLPAMIIQRANPQLYDLLTNGVLQGRLDFDSAKTSCEELANKAADYMADSGWGFMAKNQNYQDIASSEQDIIKAKKKSETQDGEKGINWIGGEKKGGKNQDLINVVSDVTKAGFNILMGKDVKNTSPITKQECDGMLCTTWETPQEASDWTASVIGETSMSTCNGCGQSNSKAGRGLAPLIEQENIQVLLALEDVLNTDNPTLAQLQSVSSSTMPVTRGLIEALREDSDVVVLSSRLSSEVAISRILEKAILARRTLLAGMREPNVANNEKAQADLEKSLTLLDREIEQVKMEMELQRNITGNTAIAILNKQIAEQQKSLDNNTSSDIDKKLRQVEGKKEDANLDNSNEGDFDIDQNLIKLNIPEFTGGLNNINGGYSYNAHAHNGNTVRGSKDLSKYETKDAYADGRATIYKTKNGKTVRREGGTLAWRNNNPGNIRAGEFAEKHGAIGVGPGGFAIFPDPETGHKAIKLLLKSDDYRNQSIAGAISRYAPPSENNTEMYIKMVTKSSGLHRGTKLNSLTDSQREHIINAIRKHEGWKEGKTKEIN